MREILKYPLIYNFYQHLIGCDKYLKVLTKEFLVNPSVYSVDKKELKILEIGCATGNIIKFLKKYRNINYTGIDISKEYIKYAVSKYPEYKFICTKVDKNTNFNTIYNVIFLEGVLSGVNDNDVIEIFSFILNHSDQNTVIFISDTNYKKDLSYIKRFLYSKERNKYMRTEDKYKLLLEKYFYIEKISVNKHPYIIPYEKIIFELRKTY